MAEWLSLGDQQGNRRDRIPASTGPASTDLT